MTAVRDAAKIRKSTKPLLLGASILSLALCIYVYFDPPLALSQRIVVFIQSLSTNFIASIFTVVCAAITLGGINRLEKEKERKESLEDIYGELEKFWKQKIDEEKTNFKNEILIGVQNIADGLTKGLASDVFEMASWYIADCKEICVIGTVNMNLAAKEFESEGVEKCVKATEKRIQDNQGLRYRRITALNLNPLFHNHLKNCFDLKKSKSELNLIFLGDFSPAYTYLIVDKRFLMVSLTYGERDNQRFCLYTEDEGSEVILEFIKHFDTIWDDEIKKKNVVITQIEEFKHTYEYQSNAETQLKIIKDKINEFPKFPTLFQKHALKDLESFANTLIMTEKCQLNIQAQMKI